MMKEHKGLTLDAMLWWIGKETTDFALQHNDDDSWTAKAVSEKHGELEYAGSMYRVVITMFDKIADEIDVKTSRVRDLFASLTLGMVDTSLQEIAEEELETDSV